jgi:hypothetical protein
MAYLRSGIAAAAMLFAIAEAVAAQNGGSESTAMFRGGPAHTGVYDDATSGRALLGVQWRFVTEGDVIGSPAVARALV